MRPKFGLMLDHAAVAVHASEKLLHVLELLGLSNEGSEIIASQGVRTHFISASSAPDLKMDSKIEILEVTDPTSSVQKYLDKKGPGIHHLSFQLVDGGLDSLCAHLRQHGVRLVYEKSQPGAHRTRVNFIHPESTGGVLLEISEKTA